MIDIELYETEDGKCPARDFIKSLSPRLQAKASLVIDILEEFGPAIRRPHSALLRNGIFELRVSLGKDEARILFFFFHKGKAVLTHGFIKKTNAVPLSEIERAEKYMKEYRHRKS